MSRELRRRAKDLKEDVLNGLASLEGQLESLDKQKQEGLHKVAQFDSYINNSLVLESLSDSQIAIANANKHIDFDSDPTIASAMRQENSNIRAKILRRELTEAEYMKLTQEIAQRDAYKALTEVKSGAVPASAQDSVVRSSSLLLGNTSKYILRVCNEHCISAAELAEIGLLARQYKSKLDDIVEWRRQGNPLMEIGRALELRQIYRDSGNLVAGLVAGEVDNKKIPSVKILLNYLQTFHRGDGIDAESLIEELEEAGWPYIIKSATDLARKRGITYFEVAVRAFKNSSSVLADPLETQHGNFVEDYLSSTNSYLN